MTEPNYHLTEAERKTPVACAQQIAKTLRDFADEIDRYAAKLAATGDVDNLSYIGNTITNMIGNLRIDLLVKYAGEAYRNRVIDHMKSEAAND